MKVRFLSRDEVAPTGGVVCVIDVISAFTTSSWLLSQNAKWIFVAETIEQALALKQVHGACLVGERDGSFIEGFDYHNDLTQFIGIDFSGRICVLKTSSGTRSLAAHRGASCLLAASLCNAKATASYIQQQNPDNVSFIITNSFKSAEDLACAAYICECLFENYYPNSAPYLSLVDASRYAAETRKKGTGEMDYILLVDKFDFAMVCETKGDIIRIFKTPLNGAMEKI